MAVYRCPVCEGRGHVPAGFYSSVPGVPYSVSSLSPEPCQACGGRGIVFDTAGPEFQLSMSGGSEPLDLRAGGQE